MLLQVSFPPFLFEVFLFGPINEEKSEAKVGNGVAVFTLQKRRDELWEQLFTNIGRRSFILSQHRNVLKMLYLRHIFIFKMYIFYSKDKDKQKQIREQAILKVQEKEAEKSKAKAARVQQEKKYALETMMKV